MNTQNELETNHKAKRAQWPRNLVLALLFVGVTGFVSSRLLKQPSIGPAQFNSAQYQQAEFTSVVKKVDGAFESIWKEAAIEPVPPAPDLVIARRLALGLAGTIPSLQEIRAFETQPAGDRVQWFLTHLFQDRRTSDYLAERFARAYVGVENGPFLVYRRHRFLEWLSDEFNQNRPYDELARSLIASEGIWTSHPEVNFITVAAPQNNDKKGPDEVKLTARLSRAFLGVRMDCVECHDDKFGDRWKQEDFHQLAAFFGNADFGLTGVQDNPKLNYEYRYKGKPDAVTVPPVVPFQPELLPQTGDLRERLAGWATHRENKAFARTTVNRIWALLFSKPLVEPIDDIPLDAPIHPALDILADDFVAHGFDLQRLVRVIAATKVFQLDSQSDDPAKPVTEKQEKALAAFPLTRLRPEQVAGGVIQAAALHTLNADAHVIQRISKGLQTGGFVKRYGDLGLDEFGEQSGTIPQRLLLMNGEMVHKSTEKNMILNASTRIGALAPDDETAVETAFLTVFTRRPGDEEKRHFTAELEGTKGDRRSEAMADLYWTLLNSTEFAWNH